MTKLPGFKQSCVKGHTDAVWRISLSRGSVQARVAACIFAAFLPVVISLALPCAAQAFDPAKSQGAAFISAVESPTGVTVEWAGPSYGWVFHLSRQGAAIDVVRLTGNKFADTPNLISRGVFPAAENAVGSIDMAQHSSPGELVTSDWKYSGSASPDGRQFTVVFERVMDEFYTTPNGEVRNPLKGIEVKKTFAFDPATRTVTLGVSFRNPTDSLIPVVNAANSRSFTLLAGPGLGKTTEEDEAVTLEARSVTKRAPPGFGKVPEEALLDPSRKTRWIALRDKHFVVALIPESNAVRPLVRGFTEVANGSRKGLAVGLTESGFSLEPGETRRFEYAIFAGPKDRPLLTTAGIPEIYDPGFWGLKLMVIEVLNFFFGWTGSWGWAIIILTVVLKLILYPLTVKQTRSMHEMQKIQPLVKKLQEKHKENPQKLNQEIMELYRKHNVNPIGGCLPLVVQLPILFALFTALQESIELKGESFLWLRDLSLPDDSLFIPGFPGFPIPLLPIVIAVTMHMQQKQMSTDPNQARMMMFMPILMFFICQALPSGVLIYWLISNVLSMYQQEAIKKALDRLPEPELAVDSAVSVDSAGSAAVGKKFESEKKSSAKLTAETAPAKGVVEKPNTGKSPDEKGRKSRK